MELNLRHRVASRQSVERAPHAPVVVFAPFYNVDAATRATGLRRSRGLQQPNVVSPKDFPSRSQSDSVNRSDTQEINRAGCIV